MNPYDTFMFDIFPVIFVIIFFIVIGSIVTTSVKGISQWSHNNKQPILDINCKVVSKRFEVSRTAGHTDSNGLHHSGRTYTTYYVTFEFESGDRMEFKVSDSDYGMIVEKDVGKLTFQGTRFLGFNRKI